MGTREKIFSPEGREKPRVIGMLSYEIKDRKSCVYRSLRRVDLLKSREKRRLRADDRADPQFRQKLVPRAKAMIERTYRRSTLARNGVYRSALYTLLKDQLARGVQDVVSQMQC
jgi:hypothetical protein